MKVSSETDVLVVGGGTAGFLAALGAAKNGAKTMIVEQCGTLGGTPVSGLMTIVVTMHDADGNQMVTGLFDELLDRIKANGGSMGFTYETQGNMRYAAPFDAEVAKYTMVEMAEEYGIELLLDTVCTDTLVMNGEVKGVVVANKSGSSVILAKRVVDCTGDGDVATFAGAQYEMRPKELRQPITLMFRMGGVDVKKWVDFMKANPDQFNLADGVESLEKPWILNILKDFKPWKEAIASGKISGGFALEQVWYHTHGADINKGELTFNMTRTTGYDPTDTRQMSEVHRVLQKQLPVAEAFIRNNMPGFEKAYLIDSASILGVRESRRIIGDYMLTKDDVTSGAIPDTSIALSVCPIDIHEGHGEGKFIWEKTNKRGSKAYGIPYGCLLPKGLENILVAGRCISSTWEANGSTRMQGSCFATGQAAGIAAALSLKNNVTPRALDVNALREAEKANKIKL
jgi:hypothetical protein